MVQQMYLELDIEHEGDDVCLPTCDAFLVCKEQMIYIATSDIHCLPSSKSNLAGNSHSP